MNIVEQMAASHAPQIVPLTVAQYHSMIATGILRDGDPIELIDGILVRKDRSENGGDPMSHSPGHALTVKRLQRQFRKVEDWGYHLHSQLPVTLDNIREPEPDLALVRGREDDYLQRHPGPKDVAAIMEVSDSSLSFDRSTKQRLYATAEIPIYWIVNLVNRQIEVYADPQAGTGQYARRTDFGPEQTATLVLGVGMEINVAVAEIMSG